MLDANADYLDANLAILLNIVPCFFHLLEVVIATICDLICNLIFTLVVKSQIKARIRIKARVAVGLGDSKDLVVPSKYRDCPAQLKCPGLARGWRRHS